MLRRTILVLTLVSMTLGLLVATPILAGSGNGDDAFTIWMAVFNNPGACDVPNDCGLGDLGPAAQAALAYFAGGRVQSNGRASFAASYGEGSTVGALFSTTATGAVLVDAAAAEIHFIVRSHGRFRDELADLQLTIVGGGCDVQFCDDLQAAAFSVTGDDHQTTDVHLFADASVQIKGASASLWREGDGIRAVIHTRVRSDDDGDSDSDSD